MQSESQTASRQPRILDFLRDPPRAAEIVLWALIILSIVAIRIYFIGKLPVALWSDDGGSYAYSALRWVNTGVWETDPRRGAIYSLFMAACFKWANIHAIMLIQHVLGAVAILVAIIALRVLCGRSALIPIAFCGYAFAMYNLPLYLEHLIRNETLLFFFGTLAFAAWLFAIKCEQPHWLWLSGISAAIGTLTKSVFGPFPLIVIAGHAWFYRRTPRLAAKQIAIFVVALALPIIADKIFKKATMRRPPEPQSGILLYGRTAQFTHLDGGIEPEIKAQIRAEVEDYRSRVFADPKRPKLNNNEILKKTVVPHLRRIVAAQGKKPADVNKLCRRLAVEAIMTHKLDYTKQVLRDLNQLLFRGGYRLNAPKPSDLSSVAETLRTYRDPDPLMQVEPTVAALEARMTPALEPQRARKYFSQIRHWTNSAWLFRFVPVFLTTILLPLFVIFTRDKMRLWWLGAAGMWFFTLVLLSTVGRPLDRYLIPAVPVMFWTLSAGIVWLWNAALNFIAKKQNLAQNSPAL